MSNEAKELRPTSTSQDGQGEIVISQVRQQASEKPGRTGHKPRFIAEPFVVEEHFAPGKSAKELISGLPEGNPIVRPLAPLVGEEFSRGYESLSEAEKDVVLLALYRIRKDLIRRENVDYERSLAEVLRGCRHGSELDLAAVREAHLSVDGKLLLALYDSNIGRYGRGALAHLCLPHAVMLKLTRGGVNTIRDAELMLNTGARVRYLTEQDRNVLATAFTEWKQGAQRPTEQAGQP